MLDDLLDGVPPGLLLQLEVKAHADAALATRTARTLCDRLRDHPRRHDVEVLSFWTGACAIAAELGFRARLVIIAGYQIPALGAWARRAGVGGVCVEHFLLTPALITTLHAAGLSVTTGTVNHAALLPRLLPLGLDAITSDVPHELRDGMAAPAALLLAA
jgi:hypothetical protein